MKTIFRSLIIMVTGCLLMAACTPMGNGSDASGNGGSTNTPPVVPGGDGGSGNGGSVDVANTTLLGLFGELIEYYNYNESTPLKHVYLVAHRANTYQGILDGIPENSIYAIQEAIKQGADMVELDVRATSDGELMLMHDETVAATTDGGNKSLSSFTYAQAKALKMKARGGSTYYKVNGEYVRIPTLKEALEACKGKIFVNLDLKGAALSPTAVVRAIKESGTVGQVMIYGASADDRMTYIEKGFSMCDDFLAIHPHISSVDEVTKYLQPGYYNCALLFQYSYGIYYDNTISSFGYKAHAKGGLTYSNALDTQGKQILNWYTNYGKNGLKGSCASIDRFIAAGSDFLQVDYCDLAHKYLKEKGLR